MQVIKNLFILLTILWWYVFGWHSIYKTHLLPYLSELSLFASIIITPIYFIASLLGPIFIGAFYSMYNEKKSLDNKLQYLKSNEPNQVWLEKWQEMVVSLNKDHKYQDILQHLLPLIKDIKPNLAIKLEEALVEAIRYQESYLGDRWSGGWGFSLEYQEKISQLIDSEFST